jgi:ArsR family transcriptional regulator, lead/cadmium/zinc/bismuth-responsive transcriptional repressor
VHDGGAIYCDQCYPKVRSSPDRGISEATRKSEFVPRHSATVLRVPDKLIECAHCGRVYTIDGLAEDERGKYRCPVCGKDIDARPRTAEKKRPEKKKPEPLAKEDFAVTAQLFKCLADPCRVKIIESLSEKELNVFAFVEITGAQYSLTSYHLKVLKELGLIKSYKRGNFVVYSLTEKGEAVHEFIGKSKGLS